MTTILVLASTPNPTRIVADLLVLPGQLEVVVADDLEREVDHELQRAADHVHMVADSGGPRTNDAAAPVRSLPHDKKIVALHRVPLDRLVFADEARPGTNQYPVWPDLILFYPDAVRREPDLWAYVAAAVRLGLLVATWMPWLGEVGKARDLAWRTTAAALVKYGIPSPLVADRGGLRSFPTIDRETEAILLPGILSVQAALVRAGGDD